MDNPETLATLRKQDTGRRQTKQKAQHIKLSYVGKVMERVVYKYIYNYIIENSLLYSYQSGFLPGHSTVNQLLEIYLNICKNLDN
jgi:hypothetical protein